jgi:putative ABC transport system permease protein
MVKSYLKIIFRKFFKEPEYTFISTFCLGLGIACTLFIIIWIRDELSYDSFHRKADRIYRLTLEVNNTDAGYHTHFARIWYDWLANIRQHIPGIEEVGRFTHWPGEIIKTDENVFRANVCRTDTSFFKVFSLDYIKGTPDNPLKEPFTLILSQSAAKKYFGDTDPVGESVQLYCTRCPERKKYTVIGIVKDLPSNSHYHFDILATYEDPENITGWAYYYLLLGVNITPDDILSKFREFAGLYISEQELNRMTPHLQKITDIHLFSQKARELEKNGSMNNIYLFAGLALFVLFVVIFNFINLQYLSLIKNYKSLQVLKYAGAKSINIFSLQVIESLIYGFISTFLSVILFESFLQPFNSLIGKSVGSGNTIISSTILLTIPSVIILIIMAGVYPYFLLKSLLKIKLSSSSGNEWKWNPTKKHGSKSGLTKILVSAQYVAAIILIITVIIVNRQINYFMSGRLGSKERKIICVKQIPVQVINNYQVFKSELLSNSIITDVTSSFEDPADDAMDAMRFETTDMTPEMRTKVLYVYPVDDNFFSFYNIKIIEGSDFPPYHGNDSLKESYILNMKALDHLEWQPDEAVGKPFSLIFFLEGKNLFKGGRIIGVVDDFQMSSMKQEIKPYVFFQKSFWLGSVQITYDSFIPGKPWSL